jgi:hypothetical protein
MPDEWVKEKSLGLRTKTPEYQNTKTPKYQSNNSTIQQFMSRRDAKGAKCISVSCDEKACRSLPFLREEQLNNSTVQQFPARRGAKAQSVSVPPDESLVLFTFLPERQLNN